MFGIRLEDIKRNYVDFKYLLPFAASIAVFVLYQRTHDEQSALACAIKAAPILSLASFAWLRGVQIPFRRRSAIFVFAALIASAFGDVFLQLKAGGFFLHGMAAFALGQLLFTFAFGFQQLDLWLLLPLVGMGGAYYALLYPRLREHPEQTFMLAVLGYLALITMMIWRALSRHKSAMERVKSRPTMSLWTLVGSIGALSFGVSDCCLAWNMFVTKINHVDAIIMGTYFLGQLFLTISVLHGDVGNVKVKAKQSYDEKKEKETAKVKYEEKEAKSPKTKSKEVKVKSEGDGVAVERKVKYEKTVNESGDSPKSPLSKKKYF